MDSLAKMFLLTFKYVGLLYKVLFDIKSPLAFRKMFGISSIFLLTKNPKRLN